MQLPTAHMTPQPTHSGYVSSQGACGNAYSRMKTGLPPKDGDDDLIEYYYVVLHYGTATGKSRRPRNREEKQEWNQCIERLKERYGQDQVPTLWL